LIRAVGDNETTPDDLVGCLSKAVASSGRPPKIVTLSAAPVNNVLAHVFGAAATQSLIVRASYAPDSTLCVDPTAFATVPRFIDGETFDHVHAAYHPWLASAAAIILHFQPSPGQIDALASAGFIRSRRFAAAGRNTTVFLPPNDFAPPSRDSTPMARRPKPVRLVIVDPCLGRAAGHYEAYARMLTEGAQDLGLSVVWACHADIDAAMTPAGVELRRCFARCFFDLDAEQAGKVDLSTELLEGWRSILAEFDAADTHILMHSADAHQLRAAAAVFERAAPPRAIVHINFQTSPRYMPGRLAGGDVHAAVLRLRTAPAWERSLFFWAETRRLASWLSAWLAAQIPAPPFLSHRGLAAAPQGKSGASITLAFVGEGRATKGFLELPDIADHIAAQPSLDGALRLEIQNWPPFRGDLARHEAAVARLSLHPFVDIIDGVQAPPAYEALLNRTDIILLPYDPQAYGLQGSGILVEGLASGKIIIARNGTSIIDEARAGVGFGYHTPEELALGLAEIIGNYPGLAATALNLAAQFREKNNPRRFVSALTSRAPNLTG
jgi:hypothetical protein